MNYLNVQPKKKKHPLRGLAYIALSAGLFLHGLEFVGAAVFLNKVKSGEIEVVIDEEDIAAGIKTNEDLANYIADKTIFEVNTLSEYFAVGGIKLAAIAYKANN